ncbi:hypothetical protein OIDMADRAFT_181660 [Oidiodendron maius Zn]|uniref:Uncharacterized protein n=1 Tax=Oidiodendron maius (strain Zn) TaxID=913774 RepID=A0A0C3CK48_OIDMZ|nr:hypothetical protein OIDMADRAFT_181660 [Oidiodendron maius Zn]
MILWNRRHVTAFSAVLIVIFVFYIAQRQSPETVATLINPVGKSRSSQLHLLIPATKPNRQLCRAVVSSLLLGYPVPVINGWNLTDEFDAAVSHLAKVRNIMRYLDGLPPSADDDLVLIIDGYDAFMHLPADIMIKRYFEITNAANAKLEERFGKGSTKPVPGGDQPRQTILFGGDKVCWPVDWRRPACWIVPNDTGIPEGTFGNVDGDLVHNQPRWLNSGTIIGPVGDMRLMFAATMERIRIDYDPNYDHSESDQMYMSDIWGDQEYARAVRELKLKQKETDSEPIPVGGPPDRFLSVLSPRQRTEYHIAIEYESALFQTRSGYDDFLDFPVFDGPGYTTLVERDTSGQPGFVPYTIKIPADVVASLTRLFKSIAGIHNLPSTPAKLIAQLKIGANLATKQIYAVFHCTGGKLYLDKLWPTMWYYPYAESLLRVAIRDGVRGKPVSERIDGRVWTAAHTYPASTKDDMGFKAAGAWADLAGDWLDWGVLCGPDEAAIFEGRV